MKKIIFSIVLPSLMLCAQLGQAGSGGGNGPKPPKPVLSSSSTAAPSLAASSNNSAANSNAPASGSNSTSAFTVADCTQQNHSVCLGQDCLDVQSNQSTTLNGIPNSDLTVDGVAVSPDNTGMQNTCLMVSDGPSPGSVVVTANDNSEQNCVCPASSAGSSSTTNSANDSSNSSSY